MKIRITDTCQFNGARTGFCTRYFVDGKRVSASAYHRMIPMDGYVSTRQWTERGENGRRLEITEITYR